MNEQGQDRCYHCGLPLPAAGPVTLTMDSQLLKFCCHGCRGVCETIYGAGLQGFYRRTTAGAMRAPPPAGREDLRFHDLELVQDDYVTKHGEYREASFFVEGIHCAACVWLIERALSRIKGVVHAQVNLTGRRLNLRWHHKQFQLSSLMTRLSQLGYKAEPFDAQKARDIMERKNRALLFRMAFAGFGMMNLLWISIALYSGANRDEFRELFHWTALLLATPVLLYSGYPFFRNALSGLRRRYLGMDLPIAIGALTTYTYSVYITLNSAAVGDVYFDTVVNFLFVILLGRYLESVSKSQALESSSRLLGLQPRAAVVIGDDGEQWRPVRTLVEGDLVRTKPGERFAADGVLMQASTHVDESMLTGESHPVARNPGDVLHAGTINLEAPVVYRVTATLNDTVLARMAQLVEQAQSTRAPSTRLADRIVPWFVLMTLSLSAIAFFWWLPTGFETALMTATAVLIITCPCAFGLATPMAMAVACGAAARHGVMIKNPEALESLATIHHYVFDKTGTLTEGTMRVTRVCTSARFHEQTWFRRLTAVEAHSEHRIARALVEEGMRRGYDGTGRISNYVYRPGLGVCAVCDGKRLHAGNTRWMKKNHIPLQTHLTESVQNVRKNDGLVFVALDGVHCAVVAMGERLRADAAATVTTLRQQGMRLTLLSGDQLRTTYHVAQKLGGMNVVAEVLPQHKDEVIQKLQQQGNGVVMIGDGINDAAALKRARVGIALGSGTDISAECADVVLIRDELGKIQLLARLSKKTIKTIRQNIAISIGYNLIMIPLAMAALITPLLAAVSMPLSSLLVIGNAARIRNHLNRTATMIEQDFTIKPREAIWK